MPEDRTAQSGSGSAPEREQGAPPIAYDDIMQRLLEYQRKLREGLSPREAAQAVASAGGRLSEPVTAETKEASEASTGAEPSTVTTTEPEPVVDLTAAEAELERRTVQEAGSRRAEAIAPGLSAEPAPVVEPPAEVASAAPSGETESPAATAASSEAVWAVPAPSPDPDLAGRVEQLERTLASVARKVSELRGRFQDMAIAADERLAELERTLSHARRTER